MDCLGRRNCGAFPRDPAPTEGFVDEAGVYGGAYGAEDGDVGEGGHGDGALVGRVHVVEGAATRIVPTQPKRPSRARHTMMVTMFWPSARPLNMMAKRR